MQAAHQGGSPAPQHSTQTPPPLLLTEERAGTHPAQQSTQHTSMHPGSMGPPMTATPAMSLPQATAVRPNPPPTASPVCDPPYRQHPGLNSHTHTTDRRTERQPSPHDTRRNLPHPPHPHELTHPLSARLLANNSPAGTPNHSHPPHSESRHLRLTGGRTNPHSLTHMREVISPQPRSHRSHASRAYSHSTRLPS